MYNLGQVVWSGQRFVENLFEAVGCQSVLFLIDNPIRLGEPDGSTIPSHIAVLEAARFFHVMTKIF